MKKKLGFVLSLVVGVMFLVALSIPQKNIEAVYPYSTSGYCASGNPASVSASPSSSTNGSLTSTITVNAEGFINCIESQGAYLWSIGGVSINYYFDYDNDGSVESTFTQNCASRTSCSGGANYPGVYASNHTYSTGSYTAKVTVRVADNGGTYSGQPSGTADVVVTYASPPPVSPAHVVIQARDFNHNLINGGSFTISPTGGSASAGYNPVAVYPNGTEQYTATLVGSPSGWTYTHGFASGYGATGGTSVSFPLSPSQWQDVTFYFTPTVIYGCTDPSANNYNPSATNNTGCTYPQATLNVNSTGLYGVTITQIGGSPSGMEGSTGYTRTSGSNISTTLRAPGNVGSLAFSGWSGCDSASGTDCGVSVNTGQSKTVTANYVPSPSVGLTASPTQIAQGSGSTLSWSSSNATSCTASGGWSGAKGTSGSEGVVPGSTTVYSITCSGAGGTSSPSNATVTVIPQRSLSTSVSAGSGIISGSGISCPGDCSEIYSNGTWATIIATPASGYVFSSWGGACAGQGSSCSLQMNSDKSASASFVSAFNYSLSNSGNVSVPKGGVDQYGQTTITKTLTAGSTQGVTLSASGLPSGVSASFSSQGCSPNCSSTATFTVTPNAPTGTFPITVTGSPQGKTTQFNLTTVDSPAVTVSCSVDKTSAILGENVTFSATPEGGTDTGFTYAWSGPGIPSNPAPSTNPYTVSFSTIGRKEINVTAYDSIFNQGSCSSVPEVNITFDPEFEEF